MPSRPPPPIVLNLPDLGSAPDWSEVCGVFLNAQNKVMVQALLLLLIGQREEARQRKEGAPDMPADVCKFFDGQASAANEMLGYITKLLRGQGEQIDRGVRMVFPSGEKPK